MWDTYEFYSKSNDAFMDDHYAEIFNNRYGIDGYKCSLKQLYKPLTRMPLDVSLSICLSECEKGVFQDVQRHVDELNDTNVSSDESEGEDLTESDSSESACLIHAPLPLEDIWVQKKEDWDCIKISDWIVHDDNYHHIIPLKLVPAILRTIEHINIIGDAHVLMLLYEHFLTYTFDVEW